MKKKLFATILGVALVLPFSAQAAGGGYAGAAFGQSTYDIDDTGLTATSRDETGNALKLYGGYAFNQNWGVEGGYANLGTMRNVYTESGINVGTTVKSYSVYVAGTGTLPLNDQFSLFGKLGLTTNHASISATATGSGGSATVSDSDSKASTMFGIGASYAFTKNLALTMEYENFGKSAEDVETQMWSLGVRFKF
jgi:OOP family OmpA-OmpF porin